jgi:O-antigen/teichoic acid export membrane protein
MTSYAATLGTKHAGKAPSVVRRLLATARAEVTRATGADQTVRSIVGTFATKILAVSLGVPVSVILARALGADGRGEFVAASALAALGMQFGNLGLHSANTYFVSRDRSLLGPLSTNSAVLSTVVGGFIAVVLYMLRLSGWFFGDLDPLYFLVALIWIPIGLGQLLQHNLIVGVQQFRVFNQVDAAIRLGNLVVVLALWWVGVVTPMPYAAATVGVLALSYFFCLVYINRQVEHPAAPALGLLRAQLPYGAKTFVASLFAFLVVRSDILVLKHLSGSHETGVYSVAVSLVDMLYLLPTAVGVVLFPALSVASDPENRWHITRTALLHTAWIMATGAAMLMLWGRPIIALLFGHGFAAAYPMLAILAVAMVFYGLNNVVSIHLSAVGLPSFAVWVSAVAFAVNLGLNLIWVPRFGGVGAAASSLVAYVGLFAAQFHYVFSRRRKLGQPAGDRT